MVGPVEKWKAQAHLKESQISSFITAHWPYPWGLALVGL